MTVTSCAKHNRCAGAHRSAQPRRPARRQRNVCRHSGAVRGAVGFTPRTAVNAPRCPIDLALEGAGEGKGLGHQFLKHIERTKFLLHVIDISEAAEDNPLRDYEILENELREYDPSLLKKDKMVIINKIDLINKESINIDSIILKFKKIGLFTLPVSALNGTGIEKLKKLLGERLLGS